MKSLVANVGDLPPGALKRVEVDGVALCLAHAEDGRVYAIQDRCTHEDQSLSEGELFGMQVECPLHGSAFDLRTGEVSMPPAFEPARTYDVTVEGDEIHVEL